MITPELQATFKSTNIETVELEKLADISDLKLDNDRPNEKRIYDVMEQIHNPYCFRYGEMGVRLEFNDQAAPLQEVLIDFLIRKKSEL